MASFSVQKPTDQPTGNWRLINELKENLENEELNVFRIIVAFAKQGPLLRLEELIQAWNAQGKIIKAIFGIDVKGTSLQALAFANNNFAETHVLHLLNGPTFHPKIYIFSGEKKAIVYIGSNNLTVGGTETNLESFTKIELELPADGHLFSEIENIWEETLQTAILLNEELISNLASENLVVNENEMRRIAASARRSENGVTASDSILRGFPVLKVVPPSALPAKSFKRAPGQPRDIKDYASPELSSPSTEALVIQIAPHGNGEVFLSKTAVDQNPFFFGWPFQGQTVPKKNSNPSYPQRLPDPVVNIRVYDANGALVIQHENYGLNTVYYEAKSEIRITVPQDVVHSTPEYSIMIMREADEVDRDYQLDIYAPDSERYDEYLSICNQSMPSGGREQPRRFGWL